MGASARLRALGVALVLATGLLVVGRQITLHGWYSASPGYRAQVDALLAGRLAISHAPEALRHDFAWVDGGVQQVWGLGVPAWQVPFELVGRLIGGSPFPDRVALLAWLVLAFYVLIRGVQREREPWWVAAGSVMVTALLPAFVTIVRGRVGVYEEAAIYAYGAALILLGGTLRVVASPCRWRYLVLVTFAGTCGFIRPTAWCWGVAAAIVATAAWLVAKGRRGLPIVVLAGALFVAGGAALYATNAARFGSGLEFGHRLNLQPLPGNMYASRFSYPMQRVSLGTASLELVTSFFDQPELRSHRGFHEKHLHHGVASVARWREYYFTTFSWWYVPVLLAGLGLGALAWRPRAGPDVPDGAIAFTRAAFAWAVIGAVPLVVYYARSSVVSSRYQLDVAPALAVLLLVAWRAIALRRRFALVVLVIAWTACVVTARTARPRSAPPVGRADAALAADKLSHATAAARTLPPAYDLADPWVATHTGVSEDFARCFDLDGRAIDPDGPALAGDRCLVGELDERWRVAATIVPGADAERAVCTADDVETSCPVHDEPAACPLEPTAANAGDVVAIDVAPPALFLNVSGWDLTTGQVPPATHVFVDDPAFIEVDVTTLDGQPADWERDVQVAVGLEHLRLVSIADAGRAVRLRFEGRHLGRGLQVAFFAFGPDSALDQPRTRFAVTRIAWR
jgi:hypothetical protein